MEVSGGGIQFVTGIDHRLVAQTFILLQSWKESGAAAPLRVCDFGMTPGQAAFFEDRGELLRPTSDTILDSDHPWRQKPGLNAYTAPSSGFVVWLDADMLVTLDIVPHVAELVTAMARDGAQVAAARDASRRTLEGIIRFAAEKGVSSGPFERLLAEEGVSGTHPYFNAGFFVAATAFFAEWNEITNRFDNDDFLFEQNAFNLAAQRESGRLKPLDDRFWNVHGATLNLVVVGSQNRKVTYAGRPVAVLHAASNETLCPLLDVTGRAGKHPLNTQLRLFRHPGLRALQTGLFHRFLEENGAALAERLRTVTT